MSSKREVRILDATLREGEQAAGVSFTIDEKIEIAKKLDDIGVNIIEAGHPLVSKDVLEAVKRIAGEKLRAEVLAHARARQQDLDAAIACDVDQIGIFLGSTKRKLESMHMDEKKAIDTAITAVEYVKSHGIKTRFTAEDGTRAEEPFLEELCSAAVDAGADRICIADTVGYTTPNQMRDLYGKYSMLLKADLETHCHNDYGLAVANTLAAFEGGASALSVSINGIGERAGIASLAEVATCLKMIYKIDTVKLDKIVSLTPLIEKYSGIVVSPISPIVGENAFSHKSGVHTAAVLFDPSTYEAFPPDLVGRRRQIIIDKYTGKRAVESRFERLGIPLTEEQLTEIVQNIKERPEVTNYRDEDLIELAEKTTGLSFSVEVPSKIEAMMAVKCQSNVYTTSVARRIRAVRGIAEVCEITGDFDIEVRILANSTQHLNECLEKIRSIEGVEVTETRLVLKRFPGKESLD